jgi:hypothetical protein
MCSNNGKDVRIMHAVTDVSYWKASKRPNRPRCVQLQVVAADKSFHAVCLLLSTGVD